LVVLALPCLLYSMDLTVLNLAVPRLSAELAPSSAQLLWIMDIYGFVLASALVTMGTLGDRIGRRRLLMIGAVAFGTASILAAYSTTAEMLIAARALLGLAAATLAPSTLSLLRNMFLDPKQRTFAIGVWIASFSAGGALGPVVGGVLLTYFWWGSVFLIALPVMALLLIVGPYLLPEFRDPHAGRLDILSAALCLCTVLAAIFGIKSLVSHGIGWLFVVPLSLSLIVGAVFVRRQLHLKDPFLDLSLFQRPAFSVSLLINIAGFFVAFGSFLLIAQYLQLVLGLTPLKAGLLSAPSGLAFIVGSMSTSSLVRLMRPAYVMSCGFAVATTGFLLLAGGSASYSLTQVIMSYALFSLGLGPVFTLAADLIVGVVPPEKTGVASGMAETSSELGGALGIALLGSLLTAIYREKLPEALSHDVSPEVVSAAQESLGGALSVATDLSPVVSASILSAAQHAYVDGFLVVSLLCATVTAIAACLTFWSLRKAPGNADAYQAAPNSL
jgi:MFS transporter, DHA2 family, multidrug resistance protein